MNAVRPAAVAGMFYDADPRMLRRDVEAFLREAAQGLPASPAPKAIIAPHAGYVYSGAVAGAAYAALGPLRTRIRRVVLLGPAHRVPVRGLATSTAVAFQTPLGRVPLARDDLMELEADLAAVRFSDEAHAMEHCLEVQLPFLQAVLEDFELLPFAVGDATAGQVEAVLDRLWGGGETLIVVSSDLSHYRSYREARRIDAFTSECIRALQPADLSGEHACGYLPIAGLLRVAARIGLTCRVLDLRSSGDTAGPKDRVVGYGAYAFYAS